MINDFAEHDEADTVKDHLAKDKEALYEEIKQELLNHRKKENQKIIDPFKPTSLKSPSLNEYSRQRLENLISMALVNGYSRREITKYIEKKLPYTRHQAELVFRKVVTEWDEEDKESRSVWRSAQIRRLSESIRLYKNGREAQYSKDGKLLKEKIKPNPGVVLGFERLLSDLQGTKQPIQVEVKSELTDYYSTYFSSIDPEQVLQLAAKEMEQENKQKTLEAEYKVIEEPFSETNPQDYLL